MVERLLQPKKQELANAVTELGMVILVKLAQSEKQASLKPVTELEIVIVVKPVQLLFVAHIDNQ